MSFRLKHIPGPPPVLRIPRRRRRPNRRRRKRRSAQLNPLQRHLLCRVIPNPPAQTIVRDVVQRGRKQQPRDPAMPKRRRVKIGPGFDMN